MSLSGGAAWRAAALRSAAIVALVPVSVYLVPRVVDLVRVPDVLDEAIGHAQAYNPRLPEVAALDTRTTADLSALDRIDAALARAQSTNATAAAQLAMLVERIRSDIQPLLDRTDANVVSLVSSLDRLDTALVAVQDPLDDASKALSGDRARLAHALRTARESVKQVRDARAAAQRAADDVSGPDR
jgi:chromosome segregation ATPase